MLVIFSLKNIVRRKSNVDIAREYSEIIWQNAGVFNNNLNESS